MSVCDSHAHLNHGDTFDADRDAVLQRARDAGVEAILNVATGDGDAPATVEVARRHPDVRAAVGVHPHEASWADDAVLARLESLAADPVVVAWGEIGLDYHYLHSPRDVQRDVFARQLDIAARRGLPVSVHTREADADLVEILQAHGGPAAGVIHCFTGDWSLASACLDLGFTISFSGIVTFRNAAGLRDVARRVPDDRLLVETDSPYLAPAPHRGRRNEPCRVVDVVATLAQVRGVSPPALAAITSANYRRLFTGVTPAASSPSR